MRSYDAAMVSLAVFCALAATTMAAQQYDETITVARLLVDVRVTKANGEAIPDLTAADFEVTLDGRPVTVELMDATEVRGRGNST